MTPLLPCRLMIDSTAAGSWQMAVDEVLLETAAEQQTASLRFYGWSEPTLSLGYFQKFRDSQTHTASRGCPLVRRQTGGGAILHDRELTYCLALPLAHPLAAHATPLYLAVHEALRTVLSGLNILSKLRAESQNPTNRDEPFLCFQRAAQGDVLVGSSKVCGSAQRRRRGAVLQHGSLLLATSPKAPELPGVAELTGKNPGADAFVEPWVFEMGKRLHLKPATDKLTAAELAGVRTLALEKYGAANWNERR